MIEKFRVQAKKNGEWKTQKLFSEEEEPSLACTLADQISKSKNFDEVRVLEAIVDAALGKTTYTLKYSPKDEADFLPPVEPEIREKYPPQPYPLLIQKGVTGEWVVLEKKNTSNHSLFGVKGWLAYAMYILAVGPLWS